MDFIKIEPLNLLQAIGDKTRLRILRLLLSTPQVEVCLCEFTQTLGEPEYKLSRHLKVLREVGLVNSQKIGRWVYHRISEEPVNQAYYSLVKSLPDTKNGFAKDLESFQKQIDQRCGARCTGKEP